MTADILADWSNYVLIHDHPSADFLRFLIAAISGLTAVLLLRLYLSHRTGRMNRWAGIGATWTYAVVAWAQIIQTTGPVNDLSLLNVAVLGAVGCSLFGTLQAMEITLFSGRSPQPSAQEKSRTEVDRIGGVVDAIDAAVNTRPFQESSISEDVRTIEARGKRDDERREDEADADG